MRRSKEATNSLFWEDLLSFLVEIVADIGIPGSAYAMRVVSIRVGYARQDSVHTQSVRMRLALG